MTSVKPLDRQDYKALWKLSRQVDPYTSHNFYDEFCDNLDQRRGFTVWNSDSVLVSMVSYSNFTPGISVVIHFLQDPDHEGGLTKDVVREAFGFPFLRLYVPRLASYCIPGVTDAAGEYLKRLGFRVEGRFKESIRMPDGFKDVEVYGMLKSECRWI